MSPTSLEALDFVVKQLPVEFHDVSFVAQWSNSAGLGSKIKVHLWFFLDRACSDDEMRAWATASGIADPKIFSAVQPAYTARPAFVGMADPFEGVSRVTLVRKPNQRVALELPERKAYPSYTAQTSDQVGTPVLKNQDGKAVDGREELLVKIRWCVLHDRRPKTLEDYIELVFGEFESSAVLGATAYSRNEYTMGKIAEGCVRDWKRFGEIVPEPTRPVMEADEAGKRMRIAISAGLRTTGATAIKATVGLGKTTSTARELMAMDDAENSHKEVYVPTRKMQRDWIAHLEREAKRAGKSVSITAIYGRDESNCPRHEMARELASKAIPVAPALCRGKVDGETVQCEFYNVCGYRKQFADNGPGIRVFNHAHLATSRPKRLPRPGLVIVDETFVSAAIIISPPRLLRSLRIVMGDIRNPLLRQRAKSEILNAVSETEQTLHQIIAANESKRPLLGELRDRGIDADTLLAAAEVVSARTPLGTVNPKKTEREMRQYILASNRGAYVLVVQALRVLAKEMQTSRLESHAVKRDGDEAKLCQRLELPRLRDIETIVLLDADYERLNVEPVLPGVKCVQIDAMQNADIIQIEDRSFSRAYFGLGGDRELDTAKIDRVAAAIKKLPGRGKVIISYKSLIPHLRERLPSATKFVHFGSLRGVNDFEHDETLVIIGRNFPPQEPIEEMARALWFDDERPLIYSAPIPRRFAVGGGILSSYVYPDERIQAVMESVREAETRQAIGRLRCVRASDRKTIYLFSSQPVGHVDRLVIFDLGKAERIIESHGMIPAHPSDLARLAPEEFPGGAAQAKNWYKDLKKRGASIKSTLIRNPLLIAATSYHRRKNRGRSSPIHVDPVAHPFPEITVPKKLAEAGEDPANISVKPLAWREAEGDERPRQLRVPFFSVIYIEDPKTKKRTYLATPRFSGP